MPEHEHKNATNFHGDICAICGFDETHGNEIDFGVLNFERHKWAGVRHDQLPYMAYDLELFVALPVAPNPTEKGKEVLNRILDASTSSKNFTILKKSLGQIVKSNDSERDALCQIMGYAGILQPNDCPAFTNSYVRWDERGDGKPRSDMKYPLGWWRGLSYCEAGVNYWFPDL